MDKKFRHPMEVIVVKGIRSAHEHSVDYGLLSDSDSSKSEDGDSEDDMPDNVQDVTLKTYEYICNTCHNKLRKKKPEMPAQACANGLQLSPVPPELQNLSDLERKLVALRIPFMVIFCMLRYSSQYKARGGCTNVPTTLKQIVNLLPRMSSEVQYHPMKLKKKMIYKSHFMYSFIRKDVVIAAIKWLKQNNPLYSSVDINDNWADEWIKSDLGSFVNDDDKDAPTNGEACDSHQNCDTSSQDDDSDPHAVNCETGECEFLVSNKGRQDNSSAVEESEFREDCIAADKVLLTTGELPPNMLQFEQLENEIDTCALDEDNIPQYILLDDEFEVLAYPDMFPYGRGGYNTLTEQMTKLSLRKYYQQRLLNVDGRLQITLNTCFVHNMQQR